MSFQNKIHEKMKTLSEAREQIDSEINVLLRTIVELKSAHFYDPTEVEIKFAEIKAKIFTHNVTYMQIEAMKTYENFYER